MLVHLRVVGRLGASTCLVRLSGTVLAQTLARAGARVMGLVYARWPWTVFGVPALRLCGAVVCQCVDVVLGGGLCVFGLLQWR